MGESNPEDSVGWDSRRLAGNPAKARGANGSDPVGAIDGPLTGLRVVELGHFIAAPFATRLLADLGAEVIKVEPPQTGDPARGWGAALDGKSLWWSVHARNKKCITLNLKHPRSRDLLFELIRASDAIVENFRPGQLERWGLGPGSIRSVNPRCVIVQISGFGQNGPYRDRVAFGAIGEAIGGIRHLTGYPADVSNLPPVRTGVSLADSVAGIYAVVGLLASVYQRDVRGRERGRNVDVALYEAIFSLMEGSLTEYGRLGTVRQPSGSAIPTAAPSNAYRCEDGQWICIAANSDPIFTRLMTLIDRPDLAADIRFSTNLGRVQNAPILDRAIGSWAAQHNAREAERRLAAADIPASRIYTIRDCAEDPHFHARGMIRQVTDPRFGDVLHPGIVPKFDEEGGSGGVGWPGPELGAHNHEVYGGLLGLGAEQLLRHRRDGVV